MNENRTVKVSFRMSEAEVTKMEALMAMEGFRSRSLYLRKVAAGPRVFRRNLRHHDANIVIVMAHIAPENSRPCSHFPDV